MNQFITRGHHLVDMGYENFEYLHLSMGYGYVGNIFENHPSTKSHFRCRMCCFILSVQWLLRHSCRILPNWNENILVEPIIFNHGLFGGTWASTINPCPLPHNFQVSLWITLGLFWTCVAQDLKWSRAACRDTFPESLAVRLGVHNMQHAAAETQDAWVNQRRMNQ